MMERIKGSMGLGKRMEGHEWWADEQTAPDVPLEFGDMRGRILADANSQCKSSQTGRSNRGHSTLLVA